MEAVESGNVELVKWILSLGLSVKAVDAVSHVFTKIYNLAFFV